MFLLIVFAVVTAAIGIVDYYSFKIPGKLNMTVFIIGIINMIVNYKTWYEYMVGFFAVSSVLFIIYVITKGNGIGGGDVKFMASSGLVLGWKNILIAFFLACIYACVIHLIKMVFFGAKKTFAFGPYLVLGIYTSIAFGNIIFSWCFGS